MVRLKEGGRAPQRSAKPFRKRVMRRCMIMYLEYEAIADPDNVAIGARRTWTCADLELREGCPTK